MSSAVVFAPDGVTLFAATLARHPTPRGYTRKEAWLLAWDGAGEECLRAPFPDGLLLDLSLSADAARVAVAATSGVFVTTLDRGKGA